MPNQRSIAAALGLTQATVARALQGSLLVKPATRARIEAMARKMGYRPNPMVMALMGQIRTGKKARDQGTLAILSAACSERDQQMDEPYRLQFDGFTHRAQRRGFGIERFYLTQKGINAEVIDRILYSRGISGVILAAPEQPLGYSLQLRWERYAMATISYTWDNLRIDRVSADHHYNVSLGVKKLVELGYERIGLSLPKLATNPRASNWLAGYLAYQYYLPQSHRIPPFIGSIHTTSLSQFRQWHKRWKPDALLCLLGEESQWMEQMGISSRDMPLVCLNRPRRSTFSGVDENNFLVGELTCDVVVNHIIHNERGLPASPQRILVEGIWKEGKTIHQSKRAKRSASR